MEGNIERGVIERAVEVNVSKDSLECGVDGLAEVKSFPNNDAGITELLTWARQIAIKTVMVDPWCRREVMQRLYAAGLPARLVNPRQVRDLPRALGIVAKTDNIDCKVLAAFGSKIAPEKRKQPSKNEEKLRELVLRRQQLIEISVAEIGRLEYPLR